MCSVLILKLRKKNRKKQYLMSCLSYFLCASRFELNFAVNVLGTYATTELMLPLLEKASPDARVITVSSGGMYTTSLTSDLQVFVFLPCLGPFLNP